MCIRDSRNVRRTARDYLIYVVTLVLSVGMFYGFFSLVSPYYNCLLYTSIRSKIEADGGAPYIKTVYGMGYQWTGGEAK